MRVVMLSGDPFILDPDSSVRKRIIDYGNLTSELHIVLLSSRIPQKTVADHIKINEGIWVYPVLSTSRISAMLNAFFVGMRVIKRHNIKNTDSLISAQDPFELGLLSWVLAKLCKLPLQLQVHNDFSDRHFLSESKLSPIRKLISRFLLPRATRVRVVNNTIYNTLTQRPYNIATEKIDILPVFVSVPDFDNRTALFDLKTKHGQFSKIILMVGRLVKQKNYHTAFLAFKEVLRQHPDTGLVILGDGGDEKLVKKEVMDMNISKSVVFEDWQNDVASYYKSADIFFHSADYEGYGMVFIEAAAAGVPIVSTNVGIMDDVFTHGKSAQIANTRDNTTLAQHLIQLLNNPALGKELAHNAKALLATPTYSDKAYYLRQYAESWAKCIKNNEIGQ